MQQLSSDDLRLLEDRKSRHFKGKAWEAWAKADSSAHESTHTLPDNERTAAVLTAWQNYVELDLVPLVREAVPHAVDLARHAKSTFADRERFVQELVSEWIIWPAQRHTKFWFIAACNGPAHKMTFEELESRVSHQWELPEWFKRDLRSANAVSLVSNKQNDLAARLLYVCSDAISAIAERLMSDLAPAPRHDTQKRIALDSRTTAIDFSPSEDYRSIVFSGKVHTTTAKQAQTIGILHDAYKSGRPDVGKGTLLKKIESETSELKAIFKGSPLWQTLVVRGERKGTYRLNLL